MTTARQKLSTYAITILTLNRHRHFQRTENAELFIETLFRYREQGKFLLHGFAVMPDHVHILVTPAIDVSTARCIQFIKGGYSFAAKIRKPDTSGTPVITSTESAMRTISVPNCSTSRTILRAKAFRTIRTFIPLRDTGHGSMRCESDSASEHLPQGLKPLSPTMAGGPRLKPWLT
jgi:REP element-mobilizing transposase RayT